LEEPEKKSDTEEEQIMRRCVQTSEMEEAVGTQVLDSECGNNQESQVEDKGKGKISAGSQCEDKREGRDDDMDLAEECTYASTPNTPEERKTVKEPVFSPIQLSYVLEEIEAVIRSPVSSSSSLYPSPRQPVHKRNMLRVVQEDGEREVDDVSNRTEDSYTSFGMLAFRQKGGTWC
jgi:hypothetical protein